MALFSGLLILHFAKFATQRGKILEFVRLPFWGLAMLVRALHTHAIQNQQRKINRYDRAYIGSIKNKTRFENDFKTWAESFGQSDDCPSIQDFLLYLGSDVSTFYNSPKYSPPNPTQPEPLIILVRVAKWLASCVYRCIHCMANPLTWGGIAFLTSCYWGWVDFSFYGWISYSIILCGASLFTEWIRAGLNFSLIIENNFPDNV